MDPLFIIRPRQISEQLNSMLEIFTSSIHTTSITLDTPFPNLNNKKILFVLELDEIGCCEEVLGIMLKLYRTATNSLEASTGAVIVHSFSELYTKSAASHITFLANRLGCCFIGHPVVEATSSLSNFLTWQKSLDMSLQDICLTQCNRLFKRLIEDEPVLFDTPKILALHASKGETSNTLMLWNIIKNYLPGCDIEDLNVENGTIHDCIGCSFTTCIHYSKQNSCFYGGYMVKEILPAIERADAVVMVCPNYNDAISANLTAVINRTTALYRKISFYNKYLFSIIVSGNSGSDSVARQLINALNINKGFRLPSYSMIMKTANDPGTIRNVLNIEDDSKTFADNMLANIKNKKIS